MSPNEPKDEEKIGILEERFGENLAYFWNNIRIAKKLLDMWPGIELLPKLDAPPIPPSQIDELLKYVRRESARYTEIAHGHRDKLNQICRDFAKLAALLDLDPEPFHEVIVNYTWNVPQSHEPDPLIENAHKAISQIKVKFHAGLDVMAFAPKGNSDKPHVNETAEKIALHIDAHPGQTGKEIADKLELARETISDTVSKVLKHYGYFNVKGGGGYHPPTSGPTITELVKQRENSKPKPSKN